MAGGPCLVISSSHRTDILFSSDDDQRAEIFKMWAVYADQEINPNDNKFSFYKGRKEVLDSFFTSLVALHKMGDWYEEYLVELREVCKSQGSNPILKELMECEKYLQENDKTLDRPPLKFLPDIRTSTDVSSDLANDSSKFIN